ncbi:yopX family protein [Carnobacterium maltaromaticum LMA28]|uniref:YopX family protein n=1 Tax=Carnobacterium maltaromaticum LMA28 TaxID=1234679 RepID=K8EVK9_CARML|nr:YopX family protein [Carnobacterium maltaromaticum]CCO12731.2 yopX family protein [Carnobacterium maltaromaticum LMA28]
MRETKFRGKVIGEFNELEALGIIDKKGWVVGNLIQNGNHPMIVGDLVEIDDEYIVHDWWVSVIPESVGQYSGLKDMDREEIFEGAIGWDERGEVHGKIVFDEGGFLFEWENMQDDLFECCGDIVIVGNIYDNPELLGEAK